MKKESGSKATLFCVLSIKLFSVKGVFAEAAHGADPVVPSSSKGHA